MIRAIRKYVLRGFRYIHVTDRAMLWFNFHAIPYLSHNFQEVFRAFGVLDLQWMLGGMPCGIVKAIFFGIPSLVRVLWRRRSRYCPIDGGENLEDNHEVWIAEVKTRTLADCPEKGGFGHRTM